MLFVQMFYPMSLWWVIKYLLGILFRNGYDYDDNIKDRKSRGK